jgi:hypothetical protein
MPIRELFAKNITRDIPPVVYFHEDDAARLDAEISEYIITGGQPDAGPAERDGIHDQFVRLLNAIAPQLGKGHLNYPPAVWISGFYGSGKSSFAKLLGLALDGRALPDGRTVAQALLAQDQTPRAHEFHTAWQAITEAIDPMAVVFDIGGRNQEGEQIHLTILRELRMRLGYAERDSVGEYELLLQRDGHYEAFLEHAEAELGMPWAQANRRALVEQDFSAIMARQFPQKFADPLDWFMVFEQRHASPSASDAARSIDDMLRHTGHADRTLFIVIDEVSQYLQQDGARMLALQSFVSELESRLKGRVWLLVTGQEKLEEAVAQRKDFGKMQDRFPSRFRVHLSSANIREVIHQRLLQKDPERVAALEALYQAHRPDLINNAHGGEQLTQADFVDLYPLLPGWTDLLMQLTSALRTRSSRAQGDNQAIRGLLQMLGDLFREGLADAQTGTLISIDRVFSVQHTALDNDVQQSLLRLRERLRDAPDLTHRVTKAVALLELLSEQIPVTAQWIAQCLYDHVGAGNREPEITEILHQLKADNLLAFSERYGYKLQSSAAEEWNDERRRYGGVGGDKISAQVSERLAYLIGLPGNTSLRGRSFPWRALYTDGRQHRETVIKRSADPGALVLDLRFLPKAEATDTTWQKRSDEPTLRDRIIWLCSNRSGVDELARQWARSDYMVRRYKPLRETLVQRKKELLVVEEGRLEDLANLLTEAVDGSFQQGQIFFRGQRFDVPTLGQKFAAVAETIGQRIIEALYSQFEPTRIPPSELTASLQPVLGGLSAKLTDAGLGLYTHENGRYEPTCSGQMPQALLQYIKAESGTTGHTLLQRFGAPPYGYDASAVRAAIAALLRAGKLKAQPESGDAITSVRDLDAKELFQRDRPFKAATWLEADDGGITHNDRARVAKFFKTTFKLDHQSREETDLADAAEKHLPALGRDLQAALKRLSQLPAPRPDTPKALTALQPALEACLRNLRSTRNTVLAVRKQLPTLRDGAQAVRALNAALTDALITALTEAAGVRDAHAAQLDARPDINTAVQATIERLRAQLAQPKPWIGLNVSDLQPIRDAYLAVRTHLLGQHEAEAEAARDQLKRRKGYPQLTADESNQVLRPIGRVVSASVEATQPTLQTLEDAFGHQLDRAIGLANDAFDRILESKRPKPPPPPKPDPTGKPVTPPRPLPPRIRVAKVHTRLRNQTVESVEDLDRLLADLRARVQAELGPGVRVRLV